MTQAERAEAPPTTGADLGGSPASTTPIAFAAMLDECRSLLERSRRLDAARSSKVAVLAIADAMLAAFDLAPLADSPAPRRLVNRAAGMLDEATPSGPIEASNALASLFENAVGERGRRNEGAVYTPPDVVEFMVREAFAAKLSIALGLSDDVARVAATGNLGTLDQTERAKLAALLPRLRIVDPAVGAGAFLIGAAGALAQLQYALRVLGTDVSERLATKRKALDNCCRGFEVDPDATRLAGAVLALACHDGKTSALPDVITTRNALIGGMGHACAPDGWDVVLMNPPYIGAKQLRRRLGREVQDTLRARDGFAGDLLGHFLIRGLEGTAEGGVMSAIVSDTAFTMSSAVPVRNAVFDRSSPFSLAWCRPFIGVAPQGGVLTTVRGPAGQLENIACFEASRGQSLTGATSRRLRSSEYTMLPGHPLFRPSRAATQVTKRWGQVRDLERVWRVLSTRPNPNELSKLATALETGDWTLLGVAVEAGQGLATGDDRRFVGFIDGTDEARLALERQHRILDVLRSDPSWAAAWRAVKRRLGRGETPGRALVAALDLRDRGLADELPGRKPFCVVPFDDVCSRPLEDHERHDGISEGPHWVPYETSDRSGSSGGRRWTRPVPTVVDWSSDAVALLRRRLGSGHRKPVLRHEELWFRGGVTHNRVASHLRARVLAEGAIFSSESPCYVPSVPWLDAFALLALLNSPIAEFALKTFLGTRNHIELGHVRRLPVPVLSNTQRHVLTRLGALAVDAANHGQADLRPIEKELDEFTRELYRVPARLRLPTSR